MLKRNGLRTSSKDDIFYSLPLHLKLELFEICDFRNHK